MRNFISLREQLILAQQLECIVARHMGGKAPQSGRCDCDDVKKLNNIFEVFAGIESAVIRFQGQAGIPYAVPIDGNTRAKCSGTVSLSDPSGASRHDIPIAALIAIGAPGVNESGSYENERTSERAVTVTQESTCVPA